MKRFITARQVLLGICLGGLVSTTIIFLVPQSFFVLQGENSFWEVRSITSDLLLANNLPDNFASVADFFSELSERKGGVYAYKVLAQASLPPNIDTHLVGHLVGDNLYKQKGLHGMGYCTHDFRNACSHAIVIGALLNDGIGIFDTINEVCKTAPGLGMGYSMCFHGFGHGVLAFVDYELPDAFDLCSKVGTESFGDYEFNECVGGVVMEMRGGIHDPEIWKEKSGKYLDQADPAEMCEHSFIPEQVKEICYIYLSPFIFDAVGSGDLPIDQDIITAFNYCDNIRNTQYSRMCSGGFGKEFVSLEQGRDIREIENLSDAQLSNIVRRCALSESEEGFVECIVQAGNSLFWGGDYAPSLSVRFCHQIHDDHIREVCYEKIIKRAVLFGESLEEGYKKELCELLPKQEKTMCMIEVFG